MMFFGRNDVLWDFSSSNDASQWMSMETNFLENHGNSSDSLYKGMIFSSKEELIVACQNYSVLNRVEFWTKKSDPSRLILVCREQGNDSDPQKCQWYMRAILRKKTLLWEITQLNNNHTCEKDCILQDSVHFNKLYIATQISELIREDIRLAPKNIKQIVKKNYGFDITYKKSWNVRQKALELLFGEWNQSFAELGPYLNAVLAFNPGSYVNVDTSEMGDGSSCVNKVFWAFAPAIEGFKYCRPVISVDGTHLYGKYQGVLMIAIGFDGNNHLLPLAFAIVERENNETWSWFMSCIRQGVTQRTDLTVVSDRHIGIINAMKETYWSPRYAYHRVCCRHLASNLMKKVSSKQVRDQLKRVAYQNQKTKCMKSLNALKRVISDSSVIRWLEELPLEKWTLAFDEDGRRWGALTTNSSECYNNILKGGRDLPIRALIDYTLKQNNEYFTRRRGMYDEHQSIYVPIIHRKLEALKEKCRGHDVEVYDREKMIVKVITARKRHVHAVNVHEGTCTCGKWQLFHYPCSHLLAVCRKERISYKQFVAPEYLMENYRNTWAPKFHIIPDMQEWPYYAGEYWVPNAHFRRNKMGRHPTQRIRNEMDGRMSSGGASSSQRRDGASSSQQKKCSRCGETGHNRRSCNAL